ncbi:uncharacterized protein LOC103279950 [Anolis carolinensis]|uniref:uncharacterized protein LOC103279950 n=1 Tax=Anolis carolinensis TaxID=28377 RepID=UPI002F2B4FE3
MAIQPGKHTTTLSIVPLSWTNHYLIRFRLTMTLKLCKGGGLIKMVHPRRLMDPNGFLVAFGNFSATMEGDSVKGFHGRNHRVVMCFLGCVAMFQKYSLLVFHSQLHRHPFQQPIYYPHLLPFSVSDQNEDMKITVNLTKLSQAEKGEKATSIVVAQAGSSIRLLCHMDGRPNLTLTWMKGNISNPNGRKNHVLRLTKITPEDAGEYQCQAENQQQTVRVTVQYAPELSISPQRNTTCWHQDNSVLCHCSFKAQPPAQIQWQADGETITEESSRKNLKVTSLIQENEVTSSFNWTDSIEIDHRILCVASNSFGVYTVQFLLSTFKDGNTKDCSPGVPGEMFTVDEMLANEFGNFSATIFLLLGLIKALFFSLFFLCTFWKALLSQKGNE